MAKQLTSFHQCDRCKALSENLGWQRFLLERRSKLCPFVDVPEGRDITKRVAKLQENRVVLNKRECKCFYVTQLKLPVV